MIEGVDLSSNNGAQNWPHLRAQDVCFAGARVSHGTALDHAAEGHLRGAHEAGVELLIAYHYLTDAPATEQAAAFLLAVARIESLLGVELALAVDMEDLPGHAPWPREAYEVMAREVIRLVREAKRRPCGVYVSPAFAAQLDLSWWFAESPLWLARWAPAPGTPPKPWGAITVWQNRVDTIDHDLYAGTIEELRAAFGLGTWTAPLEALGQVAETSDAAAGRCSSDPEDFCERKEGP